jgi:GTP 3',8-cyclase
VTISLGLPSPSPRVGAFGERGTLPADRPAAPGLIDRFGRTATDLRVSLTDRCNLRCSYCMPAEGLDWLPKPEVLTDDEIVRLIRIAVEDLGVDEIRYTGGEPLLRRGIEDILTRVAGLPRRPTQSMTTNGIGLARRASELRSAGLDRINVSLDTLDSATFLKLTRRPRLADVLDGLVGAHEAGLRPVKINTVLLRGVNDHEAADLLTYSLTSGFELRFIEQMPLDAQHGWQRSEMVTAAEITERLQRSFTLTPHAAPRNGAPAELFDACSLDGTLSGTVGIVGSVTRPFCGDCDRTRLTADGQIRSCLFARTETDLRGLLRDGATDTEIADAWRGAMWAKAAGHGINDTGFLQPDRPMSAIGG